MVDSPTGTTTATETVTTPVAPEGNEPTWAKPVVAGFSLAGFVIALAIAYFAKSDSALLLLMGACITNASTVVNYYFGSSSGSAKKTSLLAPSAPITTTTTVPQITPTTSGVITP